MFFYNEEDPASTGYGSACLVVVGYKPRIKAMCLHGRFVDGLSVLWKYTATGNFQPNDERNDSGLTRYNGGSILLPGNLAQKEKRPIQLSSFGSSRPAPFGVNLSHMTVWRDLQELAGLVE